MGLSYYDDPDLYDALLSDWDDADFWLRMASLAPQNMPVLELGVGTGRIARRVHRAGYVVSGIDNHPRMLNRAAKAGLEVAYGDIACFTRRGVGLIILSVNTLSHLTAPADQLSCLRCIREALAPGGLAVIDLHAPNHEALGMISDAREFGPFPLLSGGFVSQTCTGCYRPSTQTVEVTAVTRYHQGETVRERTDTFPLHRFYPCELAWLAAAAGLTVKDRYGDYDGCPYSDESPRMITVLGAL